MRKGIIYKITNTTNDKVYVGQTITTINQRWTGHKSDALRRNTPLYASIKKHLEIIDDVFLVEAIEENIALEELDDREIFWIKEYNSLHPNGYNLSHGGNGYLTEEERKEMSERVSGENNPMYGMYGELNPFYGKTHSEETKAHLSELAIGRQHSEEAKQKIGESTKRRHEELGHPMLGRSHTEEARRRISEAQLGKIVSDETREKMSQNHARKRAVLMLDKKTEELIAEFESMALAVEWIKENTNYKKAKSSEISSNCSGKKKSAYSFKWKYKEPVETIM